MPIPYHHISKSIPKPEPTYYKILNLSRAANHDETSVKKAYHRSLLLHHPDKIGANGSSPEYTVSQIQSAYNTLVDPVKKADYDRNLFLRSRDDCVSSLEGLEIVDLDAFDFGYPHQILRRYEQDIDYREEEEEKEPRREGDAKSEEAEDNQDSMWTRKCRCGDPVGYVIMEKDLEREIEEDDKYLGTDSKFDKRREILVECRGCSLVIRVAFAISNGL